MKSKHQLFFVIFLICILFFSCEQSNNEIPVKEYSTPTIKGTVSLPAGSTVNPELIGKRLCQACLDRFAGYYYESDHPTEVAVINFSTREIHPLIETYTWFISGSYSVYCDFDTRNRIRLAVSYSPPRYSESIRE